MYRSKATPQQNSDGLNADDEYDEESEYQQMKNQRKQDINLKDNLGVMIRRGRRCILRCLRFS